MASPSNAAFFRMLTAMRPSDECRRALVAEVDDSLRAGHGTMLDLDQQQRCVRARPDTAPAMVLLPASEADERLRFAHVLLSDGASTCLTTTVPGGASPSLLQPLLE